MRNFITALLCLLIANSTLESFLDCYTLPRSERRALVVAFSDGQVSSRKERLQTISPLAVKFNSLQTLGRYLDGIWDVSLPMALLWTVTQSRCTQISTTCTPSFPSRSWAASSPKISCYNFPDAITTMVPLFARLCLECTAARFGLVKSAALRIKAHLRLIHTISLRGLPNRHEDVLGPDIIERFLVARLGGPTIGTSFGVGA